MKYNRKAQNWIQIDSLINSLIFYENISYIYNVNLLFAFDVITVKQK